MPLMQKTRSRPRLWASAGLLTAGVSGGAILGTTLTAGASTSTSTNSSSSSTGSSTVTALGTNSVTIDGKVYAVTSSSDIDKNGEATLSDLAAGDKVTFSTM